MFCIRKNKDGQKRKEQHRLSRRSTSADSTTHIPLVDDKSLDSTSDMNPDFDRNKRRHIKPRKKDVETNTDQIFDSQLQQRSYFDEKGKIIFILNTHLSFFFNKHTEKKRNHTSMIWNLINSR